MKNDAYWKKRAEELENMAHATAMETCANVDGQYAIAKSEIDKQIRSWFSKYAANNDITLAEAKKALTARELKEFKWTVNDYIKHGEELHLHPEWIKQMKNASAAHHIDRLGALKVELQQSCEKLYGSQFNSIDSMARKIYTDGYEHELFTIQQGTGVGWKINSLDPAKLDKVINRPWAPDGEDFSSRIWKNKDKLVNTLHTEITQSCITGRKMDDVAKRIATEMDTSLSNANRLARTESSHFASASDQAAYKDAGVEQYQYLATLDDRTSEMCADMDGQVFDLKDFSEGVTAPPLHPYCRSTTIPYFNDEFTSDDMRAARDEDGKTYDVPSDMTYEDWKNSIAKGKAESGSDSKISKVEKTPKPNNDDNIPDIKQSNQHSTEMLYEQYELNRKHYNLNEVSASELQKSSMSNISADYTGLSKETAHAFDETITNLSNQYYRGFTKIMVEDKNKCIGVTQAATTEVNNAVGQYTLMINPLQCGNYEKLVNYLKDTSGRHYLITIDEGKYGEYVATHEFAHSLIDTKGSLKNYINLDVAPLRKCRKEIKNLYDEYMTEVKPLSIQAREAETKALTSTNQSDWDSARSLKDKLNEVCLGKYSMTNADEFMAEAFAFAKIGKGKNKYADEILTILDKYFKK